MNNIEIVRELFESYAKNMCVEGGFLPKLIPLDTLPYSFNIYQEAANEIKYYYTNDFMGTRLWLDKKFKEIDQTDIPHETNN